MTSDDEILSDFNRRLRTMLRRCGLAVAVMFVYVAVCTFLYARACATGWLARHGISEGLYPLVMPWPGLAIVFFLSGTWKAKPPRLEDLPERLLKKKIDHYQQRWRGVVVLLLMLLLAAAIIAGRVARPGAIGSLHNAIMMAWFFLVAATCALASVFYPGLKVFDDERIRALRGRAAKTGFVILMLSLGAAFPLALLWPQATVQIFIAVLTVSGAAPALYYVIADWCAGRED